MLVVNIELKDSVDLRQPALGYSEQLIDLKEVPQPVRPGCKAPMMLYKFNEDGLSLIGFGYLEEDSQWTVVGSEHFQPTHVRFIPNVNYTKAYYYA